MKNILLFRAFIVVTAIFIALIVRLGLATTLSEGLLRTFMYAVYLAIIPVIAWGVIYSGLLVVRRFQTIRNSDSTLFILADMILSGMAMFGAFHWFYFAPISSGEKTSIFNEGTEKVVDGQFTQAGLTDVVESLFSVLVAVQIMNLLSIVFCLYSTKNNKTS